MGLGAGVHAFFMEPMVGGSDVKRKSTFRWPFYLAYGVALYLSLPYWHQNLKIEVDKKGFWQTMMYVCTMIILLYSIVLIPVEINTIFENKVTFSKKSMVAVLAAAVSILGVCGLYFTLSKATDNSMFYIQYGLYALVAVLMLIYIAQNFFVNNTSGILSTCVFLIAAYFVIVPPERLETIDNRMKAGIAIIVLMSLISITSDMRYHWAPVVVTHPIIDKSDQCTERLYVAQLPAGYVVRYRTVDGAEHVADIPISYNDRVRLADEYHIRGVALDVHLGRYIQEILEVQRVDGSGTKTVIGNSNNPLDLNVSPDWPDVPAYVQIKLPAQSTSFFLRDQSSTVFRFRDPSVMESHREILPEPRYWIFTKPALLYACLLIVGLIGYVMMVAFKWSKHLTAFMAILFGLLQAVIVIWLLAVRADIQAELIESDQMTISRIIVAYGILFISCCISFGGIVFYMRHNPSPDVLKIYNALVWVLWVLSLLSPMLLTFVAYL